MEVSGMAGGKFEMNIPGETRGGMGGGGEAALGAVMGELLRAVLRAKDRVVRFKPMLQELQSTLESIIPKISTKLTD
uniref:RPW8 domain-containing protein n=1 Tax=Vitis vinifera TaxID=29760 RepID=F6GYV8_VITVI